MFRLIHWLTCKHKDVHRLPFLWNVTATTERKGWMETGIAFLRRVRLESLAKEERQNLSVPTPGPKDATTGLRSLSVSRPLAPTLGPMMNETPTPDSTRCGKDTGMGTHG